MVQKNILVIKLGALGDFIYAAGAMAAIRKHHPNDKITLLTTKPFEDMAEQSGYFDDIIIDKRPKFLDVSGWLSLRKALNAAQFARVYDLQNNDRSRLYFKLFSPTPAKPEWVGTAKGASHRNTSPERSSGHAFHGHKQTLSLAGIENIELDKLLWMDAPIDHYPLRKPYVLVVAGCSVGHPEKRWPIEHFRVIIGKLILHGYQPVLLGSKDDAPITAQIAKGFDVLDLTAKTALTDIPSLARGAACAIGNDTGPMHMAALAGCPVVMMFTTQTSKIHKHAPPKPTGVKAFEEYDMKDITPQTVWQAAQDLLRNSG